RQHLSSSPEKRTHSVTKSLFQHGFIARPVSLPGQLSEPNGGVKKKNGRQPKCSSTIRMMRSGDNLHPTWIQLSQNSANRTGRRSCSAFSRTRAFVTWPVTYTLAKTQ